MATGGNIPTKRTQSVSFYNTTGVIERHKNIYYVPRINYSNGLIKHAYMREFEGVCPPSSLYTNIDISSWSPEDRTLRVKGNIDDFRCITNEGACLNYLIIKRRVYSSETNYEEFYYAFFINKASQAGGSSILLELIPDDFTNVFFLHNNDTHSSEVPYDPFNKHMKNCYVNRQHYDRIEKVLSFTFELTNYNIEDYVNDRELGQPLSLNLWHYGTNPDEPDYLVDSQSGRMIDYTIINEHKARIYLLPDVYHDIRDADWNDVTDVKLEFDGGSTPSGNVEITNYYAYPSFKNKNIFLNQEETFKFKYQYKTKKDIISDFPESDIRAYIKYVVIELKGNKLLADYIYNDSVVRTNNYGVNRIKANSLQRPNALLAVPFIDVPEDKKKRYFPNDDIGSSQVQYVKQGNTAQGLQASGRSIYNIINDNALADYITNVYIVNNLNIPSNRITYSYDTYYHTYTLIFEVDAPKLVNSSSSPLPSLFETGLYYAGIKEDANSTAKVKFFTAGNFGVEGGLQGCLLPSGLDYQEFNLTLSEDNLSSVGIENLENKFYDPVLEAEPYKFYSISSLGSFEMILNKNRYYEGGIKSNLKIRHYISVNGGIKQALLPIYTVEGYSYPYYNEGLIATYTHDLPLVTSAYQSYVYQNQAQMKNQFAVADKNATFDILQHFLISGPNAVGMSASRRGGWGALAETGNQIMEMVDEGVDHWQNKVNIDMNQKAKLADVGMKPDNVKQAGSDAYLDLTTSEDYFYLNKYRIDELSYKSIAKLLERTGYQVNLYSDLNVFNRIGYNFIKLNGFDYEAQITVAQEETIRKIFLEGVTLLHDKTYLTSGHNYEIILDE